MVVSIWSSNSDVTLTWWRIIHFNFLLTAAIFASICFCQGSGLAFLLSLRFLVTRGYHISTRVEIVSTRVEIFHMIAIFFNSSWNFNPGWKSPYNQPFRAKDFFFFLSMLFLQFETWDSELCSDICNWRLKLWTLQIIANSLLNK